MRALDEIVEHGSCNWPVRWFDIHGRSISLQMFASAKARAFGDWSHNGKSGNKQLLQIISQFIIETLL